MKSIALTQGKHALVDNSDFEFLSQWRWFYNPKTGYAWRNVYLGAGKQTTVSMHRFILQCRKGIQVDHIDRNKLNNRRENLRLADGHGNQGNKARQRNNTSGYKGVVFRARAKSNPYQAQIACGRRCIFLGNFATAEEASAAYQKAAKQFFKEFACNT